MTQEEKRIKIAIHCGWKWKYNSEDPGLDFDRWTDAKGVRHLCPPDYFNDLNEVHEIKNTLTEFQSIVYVINLSGGGFPIYESSAFRLLNSTASEQANALRQTFGLWE